MDRPIVLFWGVATATMFSILTCGAAPNPADLFGAVDKGKMASEKLADLSAWVGLSADSRLAVPGQASFTYPDGEKGKYRVGEGWAHDGSGYWRGEYGVRFDLHLPIDAPLEVSAILRTAPEKVYGGSEDISSQYTSTFRLAGEGWHTVTLPLTSFDFKSANPLILETIKTLALHMAFEDGRDAEIQLRKPHLIKADVVHLASDIRSEAAKGGKDVVYALQLSNCTDVPQRVNLSRRIEGREVMETTLSPAELTLAPGESKTCEVRVTVSERVAPGGQESQLIQAMANGREVGTIEFITLSYLEHPYLLHTRERWNAVREKAATVEWAKEEAAKIVARADKWEVPEPVRGVPSRDTTQEFLFRRGVENDIYNTAIAYQLTGDKKYAEKCAEFIRNTIDPELGYPRLEQASEGERVQEGVFFQKLAYSYDMIHDSGLFSATDHANMARTFRIYQKVIDQHISEGATGNWHVAELCGALYGALAIQDMVAANRFIEGTGGFLDQVTHGIMADGWWYECSIGYNYWVASEFTQIALAMQPFGVDYLHARFPASYSKEYNIFPFDAETRKRTIYGKPFQKWGPVYKPYVTIKDMWDSLPPLVDYAGIMFANNDSVENTFKENYYEMAFAMYGDALSAWKKMGSPEPLSREQTKQLKAAALATKQEKHHADANGVFKVRREMTPWSLLSLRQL